MSSKKYIGLSLSEKYVAELEAEQQASDLAFDIVQQKYEVLRDAAQAVVDACLDSNLPRSRWIPEMDALKAALEVSDEHRR